MSTNQNTLFLNIEENLQNKEVEIELLQETFTEIGSELNLDTVFQIVATRARKLLAAETILIPILDENCETYTYMGGAGINADEIVGESLPLEFGVCGWVWRHKRPWWQGVLDELSEEERNMWEKEAGTMILVPLQGKRHFLGGIAGINKTNGKEFTRRDLTLLSMFASIVAIAIENAMAVKKIEEAHKIAEDYQLRLEILNKQLMESSRELEFLSLYDTVTSLPNRTLFRDRLTQNILLAQSNNSSFGVVLIDLNDFKQVNDALGHDSGDRVLKEIADRFNNYISAQETLARPGGDEFIFLFPNTDKKSIISKTKDVLKLLNEHFDIDKSEIALSASVGIALYPEHGRDIGELLRHADWAMYQAKKNKQRYNIYDPETDDTSLGKLTLQADLRNTLENYGFELYYQPQITLNGDQIIAVEALARWPHAEKGFIPPNIFIPALEQAGLIDKFTYWAIEQSLKHAHELKKLGHIMEIAINISTQTLTSANFIKNIKDIIQNKENGKHLVFEITESLFFSEYEKVSDTLQQICDLGISLSIDDFGTGYSSLSRLKRLPVSELKIDQSFVKDMSHSSDDEAIVRSTIDLAHNLGLTVVAEGVESKKVYQQLKDLGCDLAQGFLISKPVTFNDLISFLKKNTT
ncbi:MAG: EAL domain-containing protein [Gammaproteobacteria bacterium]|nr:EAL domain-containing protein [Gammaproteobacteria bacterium]